MSKLYLLVVMLLSQNLFDSGVLSAARLGAASAASREGALMGAEGEARGLSWGGEPFTGFRTLTSVAREGSEATLLSSSNKKTIRYYSVRPESGLDTLVRRTPSLSSYYTSQNRKKKKKKKKKTKNEKPENAGKKRTCS